MPAGPQLSFLQRLDLVAVLKPRPVILAMVVAGVIGIASIARVIVVVGDPDLDLTATDIISVVLSALMFGLALRAWRRRPITKVWVDQLRRTGSTSR
jgi:hypothetical protein